MKRILILGFLLFGCSIQTIPREYDSGIEAQERDSDFSRPCNMETINQDFYNCGACENRCSPVVSDRCFEGNCYCGINLPCQEGDCRQGRCILPDEEGRICEFDSECSPGYYCIQSHCTFVECVPEVCDGLDNDCDGFVDGTKSSPMVERCYSGDSSAIISPCRTGYRVCNAGIWTECLDEIVPIAEQGLLGCDGLDNNCDGCVDGVYEDGICITARPRAFDILFLIDTSGSMSGSIGAVKMATSTFSSRFAGNPAFRFALATFPASFADLSVVTDFIDFATFDLRLATISSGGGSVELSYDIIYDLFSDSILLDWTPDSTRIIVMFTDEQGQSARTPLINEMAACAASVRGEYLAVITDTGHFLDFDDCADVFELTSDPVEMATNLDVIIRNPCE